MRPFYTIYLSVLIHTFLQAQTVVFLQGTSRSGKSSICSAIERQEQWNAIGSMYFPFCLDNFAKLFPEQFAYIQKGIKPENIRHAVTRNIFMFKDGISETNKKEIIRAAQHIQNYFNNSTIYADHKQEFSHFSLHEMQRCLKTGKNLLADVSWYVTREQLQATAPIVISALVYCPIIITIDRLIARNAISLKTGSIMNYRFFSEPLMSFMSLYDLSIENSNAIDTLDKNSLLTCLDTIEKHLPDEVATDHNSGFMMHELTRHKLNEYRTMFLNKFKNNQTLYVVPKEKYDIVLKTDQYTTQECAQQLIAYVSNQR